MLQSVKQAAADAQTVRAARTRSSPLSLSATTVGTIDGGSVSTGSVAEGEELAATVYVQTEGNGQDMTVELLVGGEVVGSHTKTMPTQEELVGDGSEYLAKYIVTADYEPALCAGGEGGINVTARVSGTGDSSQVGVSYIESPTSGSVEEICSTDGGNGGDGGDGGDDGGGGGGGGDETQRRTFMERIQTLVRQRPGVAYGAGFGFLALFVLVSSI